MIILDTNYLINALVPDSPEAVQVLMWLEAEETLATTGIVWYEFLCGPVSQHEIELMRTLLTGGILAFGGREAAEAARLFNAVGRSRRLRVDAMIAATAISAGAALATSNQDDFKAFEKQGLKLA